MFPDPYTNIEFSPPLGGLDIYSAERDMMGERILLGRLTVYEFKPRSDTQVVCEFMPAGCVIRGNAEYHVCDRVKLKALGTIPGFAG